MRTLALVFALLALDAQAATPSPKAPPTAASSAEVAPKVIRNETYACIPASSPQGMEWKGGRWQPATYKDRERFTLQITVIAYGDQQFLHVKRKSSADDDHCGTLHDPFNFDGIDSCTTVGQTTVFSKATGRGAISYALGATEAGESRDSVNIMPFTCQLF